MAVWFAQPRNCALVHSKRWSPCRNAAGDAVGEFGAAAAAQRRDLDGERDGFGGQIGAGVAAAGQRGAESLLDRDREHAGGGVGAVVDVLGELAVLVAADQG